MPACLLNGFSLYLRIFFLFTPFFILSTYLSLTRGIEGLPKGRLVRRITSGIIGVTLVIFFAGSFIMNIFGITVEAFRAGSGILLLLTAITLVLGKETDIQAESAEKLMDMAVVPLAVPVTAGPASLGFIMVLGTTQETIPEKLIAAAAIVLAAISIGILLSMAQWVEKRMGHSNLIICSKITGLILAAISVQMMTQGVKNLWLQP